MTPELLTLIMTFVGGPFLTALVGLIVWWIKKPSPEEKIRISVAMTLSEKIDKLENETDELRDMLTRLEERQESMMRELKSLSMQIGTVHKRLDVLLVELAARRKE